MKIREGIEIETHYFENSGNIPNSKYPVMIYHQAFSDTEPQAADWLKQRFASNNWTNSWRWGVYDFHHYHSNTHEVLGVFSGWALLHLGGPNGKQIRVKKGNVIVIPAGVAHKCPEAGDSFEVVGAYPDGIQPDMNKGEDGERPKTDKNIATVPFPDKDPLNGENAGIISLWNTSA
ncbi:hypothetical protein GCM10009122_01570 [Fulvivirga kasyanovii]|uniref:Cupin n=1 Tax=Fulvivirga kasyanovii TaxID=396812 RepID=A0ABW9RR75_9BACT|nr:cupin domain-containing protein [Fulvivirga kasyanovii]MTI26687.1 cupin [Fulvivirga kasyanovii]